MTKEDMTADRGAFAETALLRLMEDANDLLNMVRGRGDYGNTYFKMGADGQIVPYEIALAESQSKLEKSLVHAGGLYVLRARDKASKS